MNFIEVGMATQKAYSKLALVCFISHISRTSHLTTQYVSVRIMDSDIFFLFLFFFFFYLLNWMNGALCNALKIHRGAFYSCIRLHARAWGGLLLDVSAYVGLDGCRLFSCLLEQSDRDVSMCPWPFN